MSRQRMTIPFGGGLDRKSGHLFVDQASFGDLRNVSLYKGRMEMRRGLAAALTIGWGDQIVGIFPIRKQGLTGVCVLDEATGETRLYAVDGLLSTSSLVGTLWVVPAGASTRVLGTDIYDNLVLAHDEVDLGNRQVTRVYSLADSSLVNLKVDLARLGMAHDVRFRGVARHLNCLLGWGYGTESDEDRPETLRISVRGLADAIADWFIPEHYFLAGSRGDPILGAATVAPGDGAFCALGKESETYKLVGFDPASWDVVPLDPNFGYVNSRAHVTVVGEHFYWSLAGPRVTSGGPSADLELPLDLGGVDPDPIVSATEAVDGFAYYDPKEGEVVFCFDDWAYVLHLKDQARRWSYREFSQILSCAGLVYEGGGATLDLADAVLGSAVYVDPAYTP